MVVGFIRDKRVSDAQEEANQQRECAETAEAAIGQAQQQAEQERQRAQKAETELARVRAEYETELLARIRRLEEFTGMTPSEPDAGAG